MKTFIQTLALLACITCLPSGWAQSASKLAVVPTTSNTTDAVMAERVSAALSKARRIGALGYQEIVELLMGEQFEELERLSKDYENRFHQDPLYESPLWKLYNQMTTYDPRDLRLLGKLDKWVKERPSYMSYCARGFFKQNLGYLYRGDKYAHETPKSNFDKMRRVHREALADFTKALQLNAKFAPSYGGLLRVEMAEGAVDVANIVIKKAVQEIPTTYYVRYVYLRAIRPRWGGSYEAMAAFAKNQSAAAQLNPRIWSLQGEAPAERGYSAWQDHDYQAAIDHYTEALRYGDRMEFLYQRGRLYESVRNYPMALRDYTRYLVYEPNNREVQACVACIRLLIAGGRCPSSSPAAPSDRASQNQPIEQEEPPPPPSI